ncbi:MAG: PAC2 family protein [Dehalococcoidia bacterium]|nr:PAC2 family protein [Dehalococcoidia bacterium]
MNDPALLRRLRPLDPQRAPLFVAAFVRKNGFYTTAAASLAHFAAAHGGEAVAELAPDGFFDFTVAPPSVRLDAGKRVIDWPQNRVLRIAAREGGRDVLVLAGLEPHLRWESGALALLELMREAGARELLVLRSWPAPVPHTRPVVLRLTTDESALAEGLGLTPVAFEYEGPVDFGGLLAAMHEASGGTSASLAAIVPNYLGIAPNPAALIALTEALDRLLGTRTALDEVRTRATEIRERADEELGRSEQMREAVERMETEYEALAARAGAPPPDVDGDGELPSPDDLLGDVERFLRGDT